MSKTTRKPRGAYHYSSDTAGDAARIVEVASRYPSIDVEALAERFGVSDRTIRYILDKAGIQREHVPIGGHLKTVDPHPWRPRAPRRRPTVPAMSKAEKQKLVDAYLAKNSVTRVPRGAMTTGAVIFLDQTRGE